jgi:hypothetical protein
LLAPLLLDEPSTMLPECRRLDVVEYFGQFTSCLRLIKVDRTSGVQGVSRRYRRQVAFLWSNPQGLSLYSSFILILSFFSEAISAIEWFSIGLTRR